MAIVGGHEREPDYGHVARDGGVLSGWHWRGGADDKWHYWFRRRNDWRDLNQPAADARRCDGVTITKPN